MKVLVTGANGFLGSHVVSALLERGHTVRAMVRHATHTDKFGWDQRVDVYRADLRSPLGLDEAFNGVDAVIHLAASVGGDEDARFQSTVVGTENLLAAMAKSTTRRIVLASSFSVYDWSKIRGVLTEQSPLLESPAMYQEDSYAFAKLWQERLVRRITADQKWSLTVLRPGAIWGAGNLFVWDIGHRVGSLLFVIGPMNRMRLTYVENCADAFVTALDERAIGQTFNVVDDTPVTVARYLRMYQRRTGERSTNLWVPYWIGLNFARVAQFVSRSIFRTYGGKLPGILMANRFATRFKVVKFSYGALNRVLGWTPKYDLEAAMERACEDKGRVIADSAAEKPEPQHA